MIWAGIFSSRCLKEAVNTESGEYGSRREQGERV